MVVVVRLDDVVVVVLWLLVVAVVLMVVVVGREWSLGCRVVTKDSPQWPAGLARASGHGVVGEDVHIRAVPVGSRPACQENRALTLALAAVRHPAGLQEGRSTLPCCCDRHDLPWLKREWKGWTTRGNLGVR